MHSQWHVVANDFPTPSPSKSRTLILGGAQVRIAFHPFWHSQTEAWCTAIGRACLPVSTLMVFKPIILRVYPNDSSPSNDSHPNGFQARSSPNHPQDFPNDWSPSSDSLCPLPTLMISKPEVQPIICQSSPMYWNDFPCPGRPIMILQLQLCPSFIHISNIHFYLSRAGFDMFGIFTFSIHKCVERKVI